MKRCGSPAKPGPDERPYIVAIFNKYSYDVRIVALGLVVAGMLCVLGSLPVRAEPLTQGVRGVVTRTVTGGQPGPPTPHPVEDEIKAQPTPVPTRGIPGRAVLIYEYGRLKNGAVGQKRLAKRVVTDASGHFEASLPPGRYQLVTEPIKNMPILLGSAIVEVLPRKISPVWLVDELMAP
jgi:hypothetical protein